MDALQELDNAAFNNFDGFDPDTYDPDNFSAAAANRSRPVGAGSQLVQSPALRERSNMPAAQFDISITNTGTVARTIELFNARYNITKFQNANDSPNVLPYLAGSGATIGILPYIFAGMPSATPGDLVAYFNIAGDLVYGPRNPDSTNGTVTISCRQIPYRALLEYSSEGAMTIAKMRMRFTQNAQISNDISWRSKSFLGATKTNTISPASAQSPDQFQSLIIDVNKPIPIDGEKGLFYRMLGAAGGGVDNVVFISMFIKNYTRKAL